MKIEWLEDSKACLDVANRMLNELEVQIQESVKQPDLVPYIKVNIKKHTRKLSFPLGLCSCLCL